VLLPGALSPIQPHGFSHIILCIKEECLTEYLHAEVYFAKISLVKKRKNQRSGEKSRDIDSFNFIFFGMFANRSAVSSEQTLRSAKKYSFNSRAIL